MRERFGVRELHGWVCDVAEGAPSPFGSSETPSANYASLPLAPRPPKAQRKRKARRIRITRPFRRDVVSTAPRLRKNRVAGRPPRFRALGVFRGSGDRCLTSLYLPFTFLFLPDRRSRHARFRGKTKSSIDTCTRRFVLRALSHDAGRAKPLPGSSVAEQVTVNHLVAGSIPARAAILGEGLTQQS